MKCAICGNDSANIVRRIFIHPSEQTTGEYIYIFICKEHVNAKSEHLAEYLVGKKE